MLICASVAIFSGTENGSGILVGEYTESFVKLGPSSTVGSPGDPGRLERVLFDSSGSCDSCGVGTASFGECKLLLLLADGELHSDFILSLPDPSELGVPLQEGKEGGEKAIINLQNEYH